MILEPSVDPLEWKSEVERVEKLLEFSEYHEFHNSHESNSDSNQELMRDTGGLYLNMNLISKLTRFSSFIDARRYKGLNNFKDKIEQELNRISQGENAISSNLKSKNIDTLNNNKKRLMSLDEDKRMLHQKLVDLVKEKEDLDIKLEEVKVNV